MIQRIQSIYLVIAMILVSIVTTGSEILRFVGSESYYALNSLGIYSGKVITPHGKIEYLSSYPFYISSIALVLFLFITLMGFKNLKRQLKLVRTAFYIYLLMVIALVVYSSIGGSYLSDEPLKRELGLGFFLFVAGLPFVFLANLSIKRDKALIDSLNRLR